MNININSLTHYFIKLFKIFAIVFVINSVLFIFLPKVGIEEKVNKDDNLSFYQVNLTNVFEDRTITKKVVKKVKRVEQINNLVLTAIYSVNNSTEGWVTVASKNKLENTNILAVGELIKGYKLSEVYVNKAIFTKNGRNYEVYLNKINNFKESYVVEKKIDIKKPLSVSKNYINKYVKNFNSIWKHIAIKEVLDQHNHITGFKVLSIVRNSPFSRLGLKKGDIIKKVNNTILDSYADAFKIYKNISNVENLQITILRGNKTMEINYEIN